MKADRAHPTGSRKYGGNLYHPCITAEDRLDLNEADYVVSTPEPTHVCSRLNLRCVLQLRRLLAICQFCTEFG